MMFWLLITGRVVLGAVGLTLAFAAGENSSLTGWTPNPIGCLLFAVAVLSVGGVGLFYLGMRLAP